VFKSVLLFGSPLAVLLMFLLSSSGVPQEAATPRGDVEHGRYIVHHVCLCVICHSPRDDRGRSIESRLLTGGIIPLPAPYPEGEWAFRAPKIAGLPAGWTEDEFVQFLQTREAPHGRTVRLPMPPFELSETDARDVAAYLLTLR
jgi:hypothetical protein